MEYLNQFISSLVLSITALFGAQAPAEQIVSPPRAEAVLEHASEVEKSDEDEALSSALSELRTVREKLQQPEVVEGAYPRPKRPLTTPVQPQQQPQYNLSNNPNNPNNNHSHHNPPLLPLLLMRLMSRDTHSQLLVHRLRVLLDHSRHLVQY